MVVDYASYMQNVQSPFQRVVSGYGVGLEMRKAEKKQAEDELKKARAFEMQKDLMSMSKDPNVGAEQYASMANKYPELSDHFKQTFSMLDEQNQKTKQRQAIDVFSALQTGNTSVAEKILEEQKIAAQNSGLEEEAQRSDVMLQLIRTNPEAAKTSSGLFLSSVMDPKDFASTFSSLNKIKQDEELQSGALMKQAADLGLTDAQTKKTLFEAQKLGYETKKSILELEALKNGGGTIEPKKRFETEQNLRKEYYKQTENFTKVQDAYRTIESAQDTAAGDMSLIFSYMKMLDPGSTVREGEFATAQNAAGVPERVLNIYNNLLSGERLSEGQRRSFKGQAGALFNAATKRESETRTGLNKVVKSYGLNPENIFIYDEPKKVNEGGVGENYYSRLRQIESGGDDNAKNKDSSASGRYQFTDGTWSDLGMPMDKKNDAEYQEKAIPIFTEQNRSYLTKSLGREPTDSELYVAHQQGASGATKLFSNPDKLASDIVGVKKVRDNLPANLKSKAETMTAKEFTDYWQGKFDITSRSYMKYASGG